MAIAAGIVLVAAAAVWADEIELTNGRTYKGLLIKRDGAYVMFKAVIGSGTAEMMFPAASVKSVKVDGKMPQPEAAPDPAPRPEPTPPPAPGDPPETPVSEPPKPSTPEDPDGSAAGDPSPVRRTPAQVNALIAEAAKTPPEWWDSVELKYPPTLDLMGTNKAQGWAPDRNLGAYFFSTISPNPGRWRQGIKVFDLCVTTRQKNRATLPEAMAQLARGYMRFEKDWPRAAYWYGRMLAMDPQGRSSIYQATQLAECYWELGSKQMAADLLRKYQLHRFGTGDVIRLWGKMGETKQALDMAEWMAGRGGGSVGYLAAGDVARRAGRLPEARAYFQKAEAAGNALPDNRKPRKFIHAAEEAVAALKAFESTDVSRIPDGAYRGACDSGYRGPVEVEVVMKGGRIDSARVVTHREDMPFTSITDVPASLVARQGLAGVDTVTSATVSSEAILSAAVKALAGARN
ncbi:MAG TPA: FMN-binding protein [Phycisphaerae bacterium]|nr:FMN-binding protein [Phycisphaerae bacterium]